MHTSPDTNLVLWVVNHGWLPFTVHLIIPVVRLLGIRVGDVLWLLPVLGLAVIRIINLLTVIPVLGFLGFWVLQTNSKHSSIPNHNSCVYNMANIRYKVFLKDLVCIDLITLQTAEAKKVP